jgi:hypothetical protein
MAAKKSSPKASKNMFRDGVAMARGLGAADRLPVRPIYRIRLAGLEHQIGRGKFVCEQYEIKTRPPDAGHKHGVKVEKKRGVCNLLRLAIVPTAKPGHIDAELSEE